MADTTIDSLSIKIVSSATEAASSLERVSAAIKKMNAGKKANQTLDFLTKLGANLALVNMHSGAVTGLEKIASAMNTLSGVKSLAKATNGLASLAPAINALHSADFDGVSEKMNTVAKALEPFAGLKGLTGLSSAMKGLKDLPNVTEKLTPEVLDAFAEKVKKVSEAVTPLSTKMTTVAQGFQAIGYQAKSSGQNVEDFKKSISNINFESIVNLVKGGFNFMKQIIAGVDKLTEDVVDLDGIIERFNRGFGDSAQDAYSWIQRLNKEMGLNVQQFMQYTSIFAQMLEGLGVAQKDASKMAIGYSELAYDIWAAYNDIYESYGDAVAAVQSAIAGQTRPLRRAGFSVLNTTLEQTAANHGLEISIQNATEAEKSYLRYLALVDQAHAQGIVGTYAKEMNTAEGMLRTLGQQMKTLTQEAGNLLLPLLTVVVPRVQAAVRIISGYIRQLAALFGVTLKTPVWDSSVGGFTEAIEDAAESADGIESGVGGAASAAKELKKTLLGIDEINQLNAQDKSSGGGGGGGGSAVSDIGSSIEWDVSSMWTEAIFKDINRQVEEIEEKMKKFLPVIETVAAIAGTIGLSLLLDNIGTAIAKMGTLSKVLSTSAVILAEVAVEFVLTKNYMEGGNLLNLLGEALTAGATGIILSKVFKDGKIGFGVALEIAAVVSSFTMGWEVSEGAGEKETILQGLLSALEGVFGGALLGLKVGGLKGALIGAAVGLAIQVATSIVGFIISENTVTQEEIDEVMKEHFGTIHLSDAEIELEVARMKLNGGSVVIGDETMDMFAAAEMVVELSLDQEKSLLSIESGLAAIQQNIGKLKLGIDGSEEALSGSVDSWLAAVGEYISKSEQKTVIANAILGITGSDIDRNSQEFYAGLKGMYENYAAQLSALLSEESFGMPLSMTGHEFEVDFGVEFVMSDAEKAAAVEDIVSKMNEILQQVAETKYKARMLQLELDVEGLELDSDSWKEIYDKIVEANTEYIGNMSEVEQTYIEEMLNAGYSEEEAKQAARSKRLETQFQTTYGALSDSLRILTNSFGEEIGNSLHILELRFNDTEFWTGLTTQLKENGAASLSKFVYEMASSFEANPAVKASIEGILETLEPSAQGWKDLFDEYRKGGKAIPSELSKGLNDYNQLKALTGDANAILYLVGMQLTSSSEFNDLLTKTKNAFSGIDDAARDGILANIGVVSVSATGIVTVTKDGITTELGPATDTIIQNFAALGIDITGTLDGIQPEANKSSKNISASVGTGISSGHGYITNAVGKIKPLIETNLRDSLKTGAFDKFGKVVPNDIWNGISDPYAMKGITGSIGNIVQSMKNKLGNTGFAKTFGQNIPRDIASSVNLNLSRVTNAAANVVANFKIDTDDSIHSMRRMGGNLVKGIVEGMETESTSTNTSNKLSNVTNNLEGKFAKFNRVGSPSKLYRDEIGVWLTAGIVEGMDQPDALVDPLKSMYGTAKDWWDSNAVDVGNGTFSFESDTGKEHYMNLKDASNESNALLREQNALLRQILEKETDGGGYGTTGEAMIQAASHLNRKTGRTMIPVGG